MEMNKLFHFCVVGQNEVRHDDFLYTTDNNDALEDVLCDASFADC